MDDSTVALAHLADDFDVLRTRVRRTLTSDVDLLTDALHALRNGAPQVTDEFITRVLSSLSREIDALGPR